MRQYTVVCYTCNITEYLVKMKSTLLANTFGTVYSAGHSFWSMDSGAETEVLDVNISPLLMQMHQMFKTVWLHSKP